jgi:hypothetical protein
LAVLVTVAKRGMTFSYIWKTQSEAADRTTGGYYLNAALGWGTVQLLAGPGAHTLGFTPSEIVQRTPRPDH